MKRAYFNCIILDGTRNMEPVRNKMILVEDNIIKEITDVNVNVSGYEKVDCDGGYIMPGLINLHVHLAGNGKPDLTPRDNASLVKKIMGNRITRAIAYKLVCKYARLEVMSGVTTIRTVGGLGDFDTRCRDDIAKGKLVGPRILAANRGITVPDGHMAGSVAEAVTSVKEAVALVNRAKEENVDIIKIMVTGGVLDAKTKGTPGELKMKPEIIKAVCDEAHRLGYKVAAHTESAEGVRVSLENGVDSIEHGSVMDEEIIELYKKNNAFLCSTISPAIPYALFDRSIYGISEKDQYNGKLVFDGCVEGAKAALENGIPVGLGNDVGCPFITQYDFWRELFYFSKYCNVSNRFALHTATLVNATLAGISDITGSIEPGKCADMIVCSENPLKDLRHLKKLSMVVSNGRLISRPLYNRKSKVDEALRPFIEN